MGIGVSAYVVAVFRRYSLGVAGIDAAAPFGVSAAVLSVFSVVQLGVYAAMHVPAGVLLDRFGSKRLIAAGAVLMGLGQLLFAIAGGPGTAMLARVLLGTGDALTFSDPSGNRTRRAGKTRARRRHLGRAEGTPEELILAHEPARPAGRSE